MTDKPRANNCTTCAHFSAAAGVLANPVGTCRYDPPKGFPVGQNPQGAWLVATIYPEVSRQHWCSRHQKRLEITLPPQ